MDLLLLIDSFIRLIRSVRHNSIFFLVGVGRSFGLWRGGAGAATGDGGGVEGVGQSGLLAGLEGQTVEQHFGAFADQLVETLANGLLLQ